MSLAAVSAAALAGCERAEPVPRDALPFAPDYLGIEAEALATDLVSIRVAMGGARDAEDLADYADCAVAGYALANGFGFARHVRTQVDETGGVWRGDAVYTISPGLPEGVRTLDAEVVAAACDQTGIPTV